MRVRTSNTGSAREQIKKRGDGKGVREKTQGGSVMEQTHGSEGVRRKTECESEVVREQHGGVCEGVRKQTGRECECEGVKEQTGSVSVRV